MEVYPNPVKKGKLLYIQCCFKESDKIDIRIYDMVGRLTYNFSKDKAEATSIAINTKNMIAGNYFLQFIVNDKVRTQKIVVAE